MRHTTRRHLIKAANTISPLKEQYVRQAFNAMLEVLTEFLGRDKAIVIKGHFTMQSVSRLPRPARNPRTGQVVMLPERRAVKCRFVPEYLQ